MKVSIPNQEGEITPEDLNAMQDFVKSLVPGFVAEFGGLLQDGVKSWRAKNMIRTLVRMKVLIAESGLTQQELTGKFFVQTMDKASIEDELYLQNKWATLLANAATGKIQNDVKYASILSELNSNEVKFLDALTTKGIKSEAVNVEDVYGSHIREYVFSTEVAASFLNIPVEEAQIMIDNFYRLNICQLPPLLSITTGDGSPTIRTNLRFTLTDLGQAFLSAVKG